MSLMDLKKLSRSLFAITALPLAFSFAGCATLCDRKEAFFANNCSGGSVTWSPDPTCEARTKNCTPGQKAAFRAYVECLETQKECSLEAMGRCQKQHPGGVNLTCT